MEDRLLYDVDGLKLLKTHAPLLVNHTESRQIGTVKRLMRLDAGVREPWGVAIAEVTERPDWLKRGTPASFAFILPRMCSFGNPIVRDAFVREISVLSPGVKPAEPEAMVLWVKPLEPKPATREVIHGDGQVVRRFYPNAVTAVGGIPVRTGTRQPLRRVALPGAAADQLKGTPGERDKLP